MTQRRLSAAVCAFWLLGPVVAHAQIKFTPDKGNQPTKSFQFFDATLAGHLVFSISTSPSSPASIVVQVGEFDSDQRLTTVKILSVKDSDGTGITLELETYTLGPGDVAAYEKVAASTLGERAGIPTIRSLAISAMLFGRLGPAGQLFELPPLGSPSGTFGGRIERERFRLPVPPVTWSMSTHIVGLNFRLTPHGGGSVIAELVVPASDMTEPQ